MAAVRHAASGNRKGSSNGDGRLGLLGDLAAAGRDLRAPPHRERVRRAAPTGPVLARWLKSTGAAVLW